MKQTKVSVNLQQDFTSSEKAQGRSNIDAASSVDLSAEVSRATTAEAAAKTEVVAGTNTTVTSTTGSSGQTVYTVSSTANANAKTRQTPVNETYSSYSCVTALRQSDNGNIELDTEQIPAATDQADGLMASTDKAKLDGIEAGAQVNVQANWTAASGPAQILNKVEIAKKELGASSNTELTSLVLDADYADGSVQVKANGTGMGKLVSGPYATLLDSGINGVGDSTHPVYIDGNGEFQQGSAIQSYSVFTTTADGLTPKASGAGDTGKFLKGDGTWEAISTSVNATAPLYGDGTQADPIRLLVSNGLSLVQPAGGDTALQVTHPVPAPGSTSTNKVLTCTDSLENLAWRDVPTGASIKKKDYGDTDPSNVSTLLIDADDPEGYSLLKADNSIKGYLVQGPYRTLLDSGINGGSGVGDGNTPVYVDSDGTFKSCNALTAGSNVQINGTTISATDTTYTAGSYISISNANVISNTMHLDTSGLMVSYNTLGNSGTTSHSFGPWRIELVKSAMATWDSSDASLYIKFAHSDYLDDSIVNGRILVETYYPWKDGIFSDVWTGHNQWGFTGSYTQGGSNNGFPIYLSSPMDDDSYARACPKSMRGFKFTVNCGINAPDWLECIVNPLYINNNTSLTSNGARLMLQVKYFYV